MPSQQALDFQRNQPGPNSDNFDPKNHIWDGVDWWTQDRQFWWDGAEWKHRSAPHTPHQYPDRPPKAPRPPGWWRDFWLGLIGTVAVNLIILFAVSQASGAGFAPDNPLYPIVQIVPWVLNLGALILFAIIRPPAALGMLAAYGVAFGLAILAGIFLLVLCFSGGAGVP